MIATQAPARVRRHVARKRGTRVTPVAATLVLALGVLVPPSHASEPATASTSYNPWTAAALTCSALPVGAASLGPGLLMSPHQPGASIIAYPFMALGHDYVGEPGRGLAFAGGGAALYAASAAAYVWLYGGRSFPYSPEPRWQEHAADAVGLGYLALSTALTTWAAWDAFHVAEAKNLESSSASPAPSMREDLDASDKTGRSR